MEILLVVTVIVVAAACLFVAITFKKRTEQIATRVVDDAIKQVSEQIANPLIKDVIKQISDRVDTLAEGLTQHLSALTEELQQHHEEMHDRLDRADTQVSNASSQILTELETMRHLLGDQIDTRQNELGGSLLRLDQQMAQLGESLSRQDLQIAEIISYHRRQEAPAGTNSLVLAMLQAEAHVDRKGWGVPPHLYALTEKILPITAGHEFSADVQAPSPGGLVPVAQDPLPEGDPIGALTDIRWPADVVGCVMVTELAQLPPSVEGDVPIDPGAAEQWASPHPDGRPARLTVGVCREGQYACAIRVKGEAEVRIWTEPGNELVTALLETFATHRDRDWIRS